jgi:hypothetical protein
MHAACPLQCGVFLGVSFRVWLVLLARQPGQHAESLALADQVVCMQGHLFGSAFLTGQSRQGNWLVRCFPGCLMHALESGERVSCAERARPAGNEPSLRSYRAWPGGFFCIWRDRPKAKTRTPNAWNLHQTGQVCPHPGYQSRPQLPCYALQFTVSLWACDC